MARTQSKRSKTKGNFYIGCEQLREAFGAKQIGNLKKLLSKNKVHFFVDINGKPFTTIEAINSALGVGETQSTSNDGFNISHLQ